MKIPDKVINRLTLYHYILEDYEETDISSSKMAELLNIDNSQVRKDIKFLNNPGKCRVGYNVERLKNSIEQQLGFSKKRDAFIVGAGNLGIALTKYDSFSSYGLNILAMFDNDPIKIGTLINNKEVFHISKFDNLVKRLNVNIAILTVPRDAAQKTAQVLVDAGIEYIWNFTPCVLDVPKTVKVWNENLIGSFLQFTNNDEV